jgi:hypothetical protein
MAYELAVPPPVLFRVGPWPNPFIWRRPLAPLMPDHPHDGQRFDAPQADFATLYLASDPIGCFLETLPHYRTNTTFEARVQAETEESTAGYGGPLAIDQVDDDYFIGRVLGRARLAPGFAFIDIDHPHTHAQLNRELADLLQAHGLEEFDRHVAMHADRRITRTIAGHLYMTVSERIAGIRYESRRYRNTECWALWDRARTALPDFEVDGLTPHMPELQEAAGLLNLKLPADVPHPDH